MKDKLKLSVSSIDTFKGCAKKYHHRYILKTKVDSKKWNFTEFGSCAHLMLEYFHQRVDLNTPKENYSKIMKQCYIDAIKSGEFDYNILSEEVWSPKGDIKGLDYLKLIMQEYLDKYRNEQLPNVLKTELGYSLELTENAIIRGYIDRVDKVSDGVYKVVDYKTSKSPKYLKPFQLLVYANAIKQLYPDAKKVIGSFVLLKHNLKEVVYNFTEFDLEECMDEVMKNLHAIQVEKNWNKNPTRLCDFCDYKDLCFNGWG